MLKTILLFIKTHAVATAITTTVVVGTAVATPIVVNNVKLDNEVKAHLNMLVSSNFQESNNTNETANDTENETENDAETVEDNQPQNVNTDEPLTFKIIKVNTKTEGGNIVKDMQGNDAYEASSTGTEYKIVPSYDKDFSEWTKEEKEAYQKAYEDVAKMAEEDYNAVAANEKQIQDNLQKEFDLIEASWSEYYPCVVGSVSYNSYTKEYKGNYDKDVTIIDNGNGGISYKYDTEHFSGVSAEEFRNIIYPNMLKTYEKLKNCDGYPTPEEESIQNLETVYHLSD